MMNYKDYNEDYKNVFFNAAYVRQEMNGIQSEDYNVGANKEFIKHLCLVTMTKYVSLKTVSNVENLFNFSS